MSQLLDPRKTKEISLPSFPEDKVIIYDGLLTFQLKETMKVENQFEQVIKVLSYLIKEWTFVDEKGLVLPITEDHISKFPLPDFNVLSEEVITIFKELDTKKKTN